MSDVFSLFEEEAVNADKFDNVQKEGASDLSNLIRRSLEIDKQIADAEQFLKDLKFKKRKISLFACRKDANVVPTEAVSTSFCRKLKCIKMTEMSCAFS